MASNSFKFIYSRLKPNISIHFKYCLQKSKCEWCRVRRLLTLLGGLFEKIRVMFVEYQGKVLG